MKDLLNDVLKEKLNSYLIEKVKKREPIVIEGIEWTILVEKLDRIGEKFDLNISVQCDGSLTINCHASQVGKAAIEHIEFECDFNSEEHTFSNLNLR